MPLSSSPVPSRFLLLAPTFLLVAQAASAQMGTLQVVNLFEVDGSSAFDRFGVTVSRAGDVDQDGHEDLMAASLAGAMGAGSPTYVRVISGRNGSVIHELR